jgi:hypothetical protein
LSAKFPWIVISSENGEPALRSPNSKVGKVPQRFRTQELAQAAADQLKAEQQNDRGQ